MTVPTDTPQPTTIPDILNAAADLLVGHWGQGINYNSSTGKRCLHGAVSRIVVGDDRPGFNTQDDARIEAVITHVGHYLDDTGKVSHGSFSSSFYFGPIAWNDDSERTEVEVVEALRAAATWTRETPDETPEETSEETQP